MGMEASVEVEGSVSFPFYISLNYMYLFKGDESGR